MVFATDDDDGDGDDDDDDEAAAGNNNKKKLSRKEIIDNALILIFAGTETSASILTNATLFLGFHPKAWNLLVEEQKRIQIQNEQDGDIITPVSLEATNAPYLDAVLKETLRIRTVVGGIPRKTLKDINVDGVVVPKGWLIDPSMLLTHEEDPSTKLPNAMHLDAVQGFRPERWLGSSSSYENPNSDWYVPYGFGPRYCLGKNLAQLEMEIIFGHHGTKD